MPDQEESVADEEGWDMKSMLVTYLIGLQTAVSEWYKDYAHTPLNIKSTGTV